MAERFFSTLLGGGNWGLIIAIVLAVVVAGRTGTDCLLRRRFAQDWRTY